jgi:sugar phosphate isomerase/epimerase
MNSDLSSLNRREFLRRSATAAAGASVGLAGSAQAKDHKKIPLGLQLYSLREQCKTDLPGMLAAVSKIGYRGVEFAGYHGRNAKDLRALLDGSGLVACGTHTPYASVLDDKLKETVEFNHIIGNMFLIVPSLEPTDSKEEWLRRARLFNEISERLRTDGMWIGYHAHSHDFKQIDGVSAWDLFFSNTNARVIMQLDTGNCCEGGADPVAVLKKYPGRARTIHIKAHGAGPDAVIGEDKVDWKAVFAWCEGKGGTQWYVLEHESSKDPLDAVTRSFAALKKMGKAEA